MPISPDWSMRGMTSRCLKSNHAALQRGFSCSSSTDPLADTVAARITLPAASAAPGSHLQLSLRPREGWFPSSLLASEIALLAFLSWLLAFGTYDLNHALQRANEAVAIARRRLRAVNQRLAGEMQKRLALERTFDHARLHDTFTGLPNRRYFMDQLDRALREVRSKRRARIAVIIVDISRFQLINHLLGHTAGDDLMVQVARRFEERTAELTARSRAGAEINSRCSCSMSPPPRPHWRSPTRFRNGCARRFSCAAIS